jgi:hypothetical protein
MVTQLPAHIQLLGMRLARLSLPRHAFYLITPFGLV